MKTDILSRIIANKRTEVALQKRAVSLESLRQAIGALPPTRSMKQALLDSPTGIIAEFKRRSPSQGWIQQRARVEAVVPEYAAAGAAALSILTDEQFFGGSLDDLCCARALVDLPMLRKEFIIDPYQLHQARFGGADAVLLIAAALSPGQCRELSDQAHELGLEVLLELHNSEELAYTSTDVDMIGINNRNLTTFRTDVENSFRLAAQLPPKAVRISESGLSSPETVARLRDAGFRGFLIGETFMRQEKPGDLLREWIAALSNQQMINEMKQDNGSNCPSSR